MSLPAVFYIKPKSACQYVHVPVFINIAHGYSFGKVFGGKDVFFKTDFRVATPGLLRRDARTPNGQVSDNFQYGYNHFNSPLYLINTLTRHQIPACPAPFRSCPASACTRRSEEHTSEVQSRENLVCRLLLENKKIQ